VTALRPKGAVDPDARVEQLWRRRPRDTFVRKSLAFAAALMAGAWFIGGFDWDDLVSPRRLGNLERFASELRPFPLQDQAWEWGRAGEWAMELFRERGAEAAASTLAISILAALLAGAAGLIFAPGAARSFVRPERPRRRGSGRPRSSALPGRGAVPGRGASPGRGALPRAAGLLRAGMVLALRAALALLRAVPEYLVAFLMLAVLGPSPWTAVLALAIHNAGVLGRLGAETIDNADPRPPAALRGLGAGRGQVALFALFPALFARFLLYLFYRWESCLREATVLGMLGIVSLGYWIEDARVRGQMDVLLFFVLLGSALVVVGDAVSGVVRGFVRRAD